MRSYPVKENMIGLVVSEIFRYRQTDRQTNKQTDILLLYYVDCNIIPTSLKNVCHIFLKINMFKWTLTFFSIAPNCYRNHQVNLNPKEHAQINDKGFQSQKKGQTNLIIENRYN